MLVIVGLLGLYFAHVGLAVPASAGPPEPGVEITVEADGKRKINLSGRQRMLSQYMAKAMCFARLGVDVKTQTDELFLAHHLFDSTLKDLRSGSTIQEMLPESDRNILEALDAVDQIWRGYSPAVVANNLEQVVAANLDVLKAANDAVNLFQKKYGAAGVAPEIAAAINIAGRQRMLTQKSSKEFCLIASGREVEANRKNLVASVNLLDKSMNGLRSGDESMGLKPAPASELVDVMDYANKSWAPMRTIFLRVSGGATPTAEDITSVARLNVGVMKSMNNLVDLFEVIGN
ncbi:MAG: type IV pili methyl-accepting chemotaxis transducer N-terminal domain-containing protein [Hyphomicrobium aestuarii]|nr:type IV pili methyl-accepting chemotaxis transducer N-terminal domain-containing protein [Hyphomicrobium aestuarii]